MAIRIAINDLFPRTGFPIAFDAAYGFKFEEYSREDFIEATAKVSDVWSFEDRTAAEVKRDFTLSYIKFLTDELPVIKVERLFVKTGNCDFIADGGLATPFISLAASSYEDVKEFDLIIYTTFETVRVVETGEREYVVGIGLFETETAPQRIVALKMGTNPIYNRIQKAFAAIRKFFKLPASESRINQDLKNGAELALLSVVAKSGSDWDVYPCCPTLEFPIHLKEETECSDSHITDV